MPKFNPIHLAFGVMMVGMLFCFILSKRQTKDMRKECDKFAFPFVKLSNYICPTTSSLSLQVEDLGNGAVRALPFEQQPEGLQFIMQRANADRSVRLFGELSEAADGITRAAGINRTRQEQFKNPIDQLLMMTHTFLCGCEDLTTIDTMEKKQAFDSYLQEQVAHRMVLLRRISGEKSNEFRTLNHNYTRQMEQIEKEEMEEKMRRGRKQSASEQK